MIFTPLFHKSIPISILFLNFIRFGIHIYRVASRSCYSNETNSQRCIRNLYNNQWGQTSTFFRLWAQTTGLDLEFDYGCYALIIDPRRPRSYMQDSLKNFGAMVRQLTLVTSAMECHSDDMVRGYCKNKRTNPMYVFDKCRALHTGGLAFVDRGYQAFFEYVKNYDDTINHAIIRLWNLDYYDYYQMDLLCSDSMPIYEEQSKPKGFKWQPYLTYPLFHASLRELFYTSVWQILVGSWLEMRYGSLYVLTLYIVGAFTGTPVPSVHDTVYDVGPVWGVMAMSTTLLIEVFLHAHYWRNRLAHRLYVLLNVIYYVLIFMFLAATGNAWIRTDADYHKRKVLATPFLSSSSIKMLMVAISFWPISSVIFLKGNVGQMKNKTVESLSNIWIDFVLWGSNMWIHRTSCECFYCKHNTNNYLRRRQKLIEDKAKTQAESAVSDLFEALAGFGWFILTVGLVWIYLSAGIVCSTLSDGLDRTIWGAILAWSVCSVVIVWLWSRRRIPENRPLNVTRTHAKPLSISRVNDSGSKNSSGENNTDVQNKAHEMIANSSRAAAQDEAEAKELAKRRRDLKAKMKTTPLDPDVKAQMQKEIEEIEESRKELLESLEKNRESAAWISQVLDH